MDNKDKFIFAAILLLSISATFNCYLLDRYDMPEEIGCISNNPTTPDTLTGFSDGKQIHIQYLGRHR
jgi:hypothetical protein